VRAQLLRKWRALHIHADSWPGADQRSVGLGSARRGQQGHLLLSGLQALVEDVVEISVVGLISLVHLQDIPVCLLELALLSQLLG